MHFVGMFVLVENQTRGAAVNGYHKKKRKKEERGGSDNRISRD